MNVVTKAETKVPYLVLSWDQIMKFNCIIIVIFNYLNINSSQINVRHWKKIKIFFVANLRFSLLEEFLQPNTSSPNCCIRYWLLTDHHHWFFMVHWKPLRATRIQLPAMNHTLFVMRGIRHWQEAQLSVRMCALNSGGMLKTYDSMAVTLRSPSVHKRANLVCLSLNSPRSIPSQNSGQRN